MCQYLTRWLSGGRPPRGGLLASAHECGGGCRSDLPRGIRPLRPLIYRRSGRSGLYLPPISLGLWWNFGDNIPFDRQRALLRHAFDRGITHFDLANNYGPPYGTAETNFGRMMREDFAPYRDELILSSKAGYDMWPGPYGDLGSRKYILASAEQSLQRMSVDYVDIFYSHRVDPVTPHRGDHRRARHAACDRARRCYVGISSYSAERTATAAAVARSLGTPLVIHQPSYSILNRWVEDGLTGVLEAGGHGRDRVHPARAGPADRQVPRRDPGRPRAAATGRSIATALRRDARRLRALDAIAEGRGQTLAQLALQWVLRDGG